ncbi:MAG: IS5/IS1182 family transposase, partial [Gammaproteobacteria bacterium]|nr:IS5/IS1182 family transposase [Gammaproteobacteria bacterium]
SEELLPQWYHTQSLSRRGASNTYSNIVIECVLMLKAVLRLPLQATQGFALSVVRL